MTKDFLEICAENIQYSQELVKKNQNQQHRIKSEEGVKDQRFTQEDLKFIKTMKDQGFIF